MKSLRAAAVAVVVLAMFPMSAPSQAAPPGKPVTVMTRNLYLGADIQRPVEAAIDAAEEGGSQEEIVVALANATHVTRAIADQTNFPVRSKLLAAEIAETAPDLVGLQEVALWRSGPLQLGQVGVPNATSVDYDFLQILLDDLAALGAEYVAERVDTRADVEGPSFTGSFLDGTIGGTVRDVRLTMHDVILVRVDDGLTVTGEGGAAYTHNLVVTIAGVTLNFTRGYNWVDVRAGAQRLRFVNTHLEAFSSDLALAQASEMLQATTAADKTTIIACDCNSDPLNSDVKSFDHVPHKAPYELITGTGDYARPGAFTDEWLRWAPANQGWTSGLSETVDDPTADGFDHRIDMIFARTASGGALTVDRGQVTGDELSDRDPATGLWPSDHAGVVLRLRGL